MDASGVADGSMSTEKTAKKPPSLVRVHPRYVRLRQGSEIRYHLKLLRPPSRGKGVTVHVCVVNNKCGISAAPTQLVISASDWRHPREIVISCDLEADIRTIQIYHKIHENYDEVYSSDTIIPSVFVSVLQKEATFLFAFGCGLHGRLGTAEEVNANVPTPFACKWLHPVQIACGKSHSAIIDVYSNIYCFGNNVNGQLGQGDLNVEPSKLPLRVVSIGTSTVLQVACGSNHAICMTTEGRVFAWGDNSYGQLGIGAKTVKPRGMPARVEKVVNIRALFCGGNQSFLVTLDNNVLATGSNIAGQLGLGDRTDRVSFERVPFFRKFFATMTLTSSREQLTQLAATAASMPFGDVELACGMYHTMALCGKRVYSWGNGDDGRLGHGNLEILLEPSLVETLKDIPVRHIACGGSHSGAITYCGDVYTWGNGQYGQVGHGSLRNRRVPAKVRLLINKNVVQLSFGEWHSMALCEDGTLYAWGFGEEGQLGLPEDMKQNITRIVPLPTVVSAMSGTGATTVRCGGAHTFVVSVLESRRPQLATLHRKASRLEILNEVTRLQTLERQRSRKGPKSPSRSTTDPTAIVAEQIRMMGVDPGQFRRKKSPHTARRPSRRNHLQPERPECVDFSWKERPMSSRTAVRNALRQEMRVLSEMKDLLTPRSARPSTAPQSQSAVSVFVSPRLRRLHDQVVRSSEAGMAIAKAASMVEDPGVAGQVNDAVEHAARSLLHAEGARLSMKPRHQELVVVCDSPGDELTSGEDVDSYEDDEVLLSGISCGVSAMEAAIREQRGG